MLGIRMSQYPIDACKRMHEIFDSFLDCEIFIERRLSLQKLSATKMSTNLDSTTRPGVFLLGAYANRRL